MKDISLIKICCIQPSQKYLFKCLILFSVLSTLWGCSKTITPSAIPSDATIQPSLTTTVEGLLPDSHLTKETVQKTFALAGDHLIQNNKSESIDFKCTIIEGRFCWFTDEDLGGQLYGKITKELSKSIIGEIKAELIEQAKENVLRVRCTRLIDSDGLITCEGNWGWTEDWNPIEVR